MSAIVGIARWDGRPLDPSRLEGMAQGVAHRGPNAASQWVDDDSGESRLLWDGRLDNRGDLVRALGSGEAPAREESDAALVLRAYRRWGPACLERMIGEFAFALWDARARSLVCARDRLGARPFHYAWDRRRFCFASEIKPLLALRGAAPEPDDEMVLAFLLREFREEDGERTLFRGIHRLPPGHVLVVRDGQLRRERYWAVDPGREVRYASEIEYVEHFLALLREAVACRLRSDQPIGAFLSGGLDSSAIVCTAERLFAERGVGSPALETFTLYSDHPDSDERDYVRAVSDATGLKVHEVYGPDRDPLRRLAEHIGDAESPIVGPNHESTLALLEAARASGCRVVLSGEGGDQVVDETGYLGDLLRVMQPFRFLREARAFAGWYGCGVRDLARDAAVMLLPAEAAYRAKRLLGRAPPAWINRQLADAVGLRERIREARHGVPFASLAQWDTYLSVTSPYYLLKREVDERLAARFGIDLRYPFLDSRLIEFVLAIPWDRRTRHGERKRLLRASMRGLVPDAVLGRRGKGDWTDSMDRSLSALCRRAVPVPLENRSGLLGRYVDLRRAERLVAAYLAGAGDLRLEVWFLVTLDRWLQTFVRGGER
jgi:asparagine synthase (glutamine-hydrolysing)